MQPKLAKETCIAGRVIDVAIKILSGTVKGRQRAPKTRPTTDKVRENNDRLAVIRLSRRINANFGKGDGHLVLTYAGRPPAYAQAQKDRKKFLKDLRRKGIDVRCIWATELVHRIHHHMIINAIDLDVIRECWPHGRVKWMPLDDSGDYTQLAAYIIKETSTHFREPGSQTKQRYGCTRNLDKPVIVRQPARASEFNAQNIKPIKGYEIIEDSIVEYENPVTGMPTLIYRMVSTDETPRLRKWKGGKYAKQVREESIRSYDMPDQLDLSDMPEYQSGSLSYTRFRQMRLTEFGDLFEWGFL